MMAMLTRRLYCHLYRGMTSVCDSPARCHTVASREFDGEESTDDKVNNSSPDGLQLNTENQTKKNRDCENTENQTKKTRDCENTENQTKKNRDCENTENQTKKNRDCEILGGEKTFFKGKLSDNICESSDDEMTSRRKCKTENKRYISKNHSMNDAKSLHKKHVQINKKQSKPALGSGKRFGVQYSNQKYPITGEILFGYHPVSIALSHRRRHCHKLFIQQRHKLSMDVDILGLAEEANIPVEEVSRIHLDQLCLGRPHQGICMDVDPIDIPNLSPDDTRTAVADPPPIWLLPFEVVDPMNMGAIIRSSYYFGVDTMVLPSKHCATASPMVSKASSGAMELMKFFYLKNNTATLQFLQDWKTNVGQIIGTATGPDTVAVEDCVVTTPTLLIVGNEHRGLKNGILEHCTQIAKLPEFSPHKQSLIGSLNVSVATGIVLHALRTNRTVK